MTDLAKLVKEVKAAMYPISEGTTLGDLFNFEQLGFTVA